MARQDPLPSPPQGATRRDGRTLLLLDEATAALDTKSEKEVQKALNALMAQQAGTCLAIAHRLSTIMDSAKIAVVKDKHVLEEGSHAELVLKPDGACAARSRARGRPLRSSWRRHPILTRSRHRAQARRHVLLWPRTARRLRRSGEENRSLRAMSSIRPGAYAELSQLAGMGGATRAGDAGALGKVRSLVVAAVERDPESAALKGIADAVRESSDFAAAQQKRLGELISTCAEKIKRK